MRTILAVLLLALTSDPAAAEDRYAGFYTAPCGRLHCDLRIDQAGADAWRLAWAAIDPRDPTHNPVCALEARVAIGEARMGDVRVGGVAVGTIEGEPVAVFDLEPGRVRLRTRAGCEGIRVAGRYQVVGD